ncbi:hypothetical protein MY4038_000372 [Beauveria bassiana]
MPLNKVYRFGACDFLAIGQITVTGMKGQDTGNTHRTSSR